MLKQPLLQGFLDQQGTLRWWVGPALEFWSLLLDQHVLLIQQKILSLWSTESLKEIVFVQSTNISNKITLHLEFNMSALNVLPPEYGFVSAIQSRCCSSEVFFASTKSCLQVVATGVASGIALAYLGAKVANARDKYNVKVNFTLLSSLSFLIASIPNGICSCPTCTIHLAAKMDSCND